MRMTYQYTCKYVWIPVEGDVKILKTTKKSVFVECEEITLRLKRTEIVKGAKIIKSGYSKDGSDYYIVISVEEAEDQ